jgi:hypothetical protein
MDLDGPPVQVHSERMWTIGHTGRVTTAPDLVLDEALVLGIMLLAALLVIWH